MMMKQTFQIGVLALLLMAVTAACGVKSTPKFPEESTFPRVYPDLKDPTRGSGTPPTTTRTGTYNSGYSRQTTPRSGTVYTPPPPATEMLVK